MEKRFRLDITDNCNLRCVSCQIYPSRPKGQTTLLDFTLFREQTRGQLNEWDVIQLGNTAEPMIHPEFSRYMEYLHKEFSGVICIVTNGTMLVKYAELLNRIPCRISISMDSVDADCYSMIRKGSTLEHVLKGMRLLDRKVVTLAASFTLMRSNVALFDQAKIFCKDNDIDLRFQPMSLRSFYTSSGSAMALEHMRESLLFYPEKLREWSRLYAETSPVRFTHAALINCQAHKLHMSMMANGQANICFKRDHAGLHEATLKEIWESPEFEAFRDEVETDGTPCKSCDYHRQCLSSSMEKIRPFLSGTLYTLLRAETKKGLTLGSQLETKDRIGLFYNDIHDELPLVHTGKVGAEYRGVILQDVLTDAESFDFTSHTAADRLLFGEGVVVERSRERLYEVLAGIYSVNKVLRKTKAEQGRVLIWGTSGGYEQDWKTFVEENPCDLHMLGFIDSAPRKWGSLVSGLPVYAPEAIQELRPDIVIIASCHVMEIQKTLLDLLGKDHSVEIIHSCSGNGFGQYRNEAGDGVVSDGHCPLCATSS